MTDPGFIPLAQHSSAHSLPLNQEAECLLSVIAPLLQALQDAQSGSVESTLQLHDARQALRECVKSTCRPLSAEETQDLLTLTLITLSERLVDCDTRHHA